MVNSSDNMSPKKDQADDNQSVREVAEVAGDQTTDIPAADPPLAVAVDVSDQPTEAATVQDEEQPPPSGSQTPQATCQPPPSKDQPSSSSSRRRKSREEKGKEGGNKRRETVFDAPAVPRPCAVCGKQFLNYKALFGHMRSHPGREWRGAFPPPVSSPPPHREEQLVETLLKIGEEILIRESSTTAPPPPPPPPIMGGRRLDIDLNREPPPPSPVNDNEAEPGPDRFDLNKDASGGSSGSDAA